MRKLHLYTSAVLQVRSAGLFYCFFFADWSFTSRKSGGRKTLCRPNSSTKHFSWGTIIRFEFTVPLPVTWKGALYQLGVWRKTLLSCTVGNLGATVFAGWRYMPGILIATHCSSLLALQIVIINRYQLTANWLVIQDNVAQLLFGGSLGWGGERRDRAADESVVEAGKKGRADWLSIISLLNAYLRWLNVGKKGVKCNCEMEPISLWISSFLFLSPVFPDRGVPLGAHSQIIISPGPKSWACLASCAAKQHS